MLYALRKLIAFVFLGGIFWFIYRDPANIGNPVFMNTLGILVAVFGAFWLFVPSLVVFVRIRRRVAKNLAGYAEWEAKKGDGVMAPIIQKSIRLELEPGELVYMHEKGTFYVAPGTGFDELSVRGVPGDVAFPRMRRLSRKVQRTHFYLTDRRVAFAGKAIGFSMPFSGLRKFAEAPGGLVFDVVRDGQELKIAFTFQNPLIAAEEVRRVLSGRVSKTAAVPE